MKKFNNLSRKEAPEACDALLENSKVLLSSAGLIAQQRNYGVATSLTILGGEELVKAAFLYFHGKGFQLIQIDKFKGVFSNHGPKHDAAKTTELLLVFDAFEAWVGPISGQVERNTNDKVLNKIMNFLNKTISTLEPILKMGVNIEWWENADNLKNRGLYVDYKNELLLPSQITSTDYQNAANIINNLSNRFEKIKSFLDQMSKENLDKLVKHVNELQNMKVD